MAYPDKITELVDIAGTSTLSVVGHAARHNDVNDALDELAVVLTVPAANTLALAPGGTERMRIDSAGNVYGVAAQNLLYNGAMQVAQRSTSVAGITGGNYYTADRWVFEPASLGTWTQSVESDAPTGSGFRKSLKILCTTADASPAAGDLLLLDQRLEGQDLQQIAKGTSSAQQLTMSFWVKSNKTGLYVMELFDNDNSRQVSASYSVNAADTWENKTLTFPADTTGAFDNDNASSLTVRYWLAAGSTYTSGTLQTTWASPTSANRAAGQTNLGAATSNYWQVTGVQLEVGPIASTFQFKTFGQELRECQRYYCKSFNQSQAPAQNSGVQPGSLMVISNGTGQGAVVIPFRWPVVMRSAPTVTFYSPDAATSNWSGTGTPTSVADVVSDSGCRMRNVGASTDQANYFIHFAADAEL